MGLEYQARSWIYLGERDPFEIPDPDNRCEWHTTGVDGRFRHWANDAKWSAFRSANDVVGMASRLRNSRGFFSLCADHGDAGLGFDRAYWLKDGLYEINLRNTHDSQLPNDGLRDHFGLCRTMSLSVTGVGHYLASFANYAGTRAGELPIAGWFYLRHPDPNIETARTLFDERSIALGGSPNWNDSYMFYGDIARADTVVDSFRELSKRFPEGAGMIFPIYPRAIDQIAIFRGNAFQFFRIAESEIEFHSDIRVFTNRHGYEPR